VSAQWDYIVQGIKLNEATDVRVMHLFDGLGPEWELVSVVANNVTGELLHYLRKPHTPHRKDIAPASAVKNFS
jgi:hypothetical protein